LISLFVDDILCTRFVTTVTTFVDSRVTCLREGMNRTLGARLSRTLFGDDSSLVSSSVVLVGSSGLLGRVMMNSGKNVVIVVG
jgi:hypothetical protein